MAAAPEPDFSDPASVVRAFIHQMHCWEALAGSLEAAAEARFSEDDASMHPEEELWTRCSGRSRR